MRNWSPAVPIAAGFILSFSVLSSLPAVVAPDWNVIVPFLPPTHETMPRAASAFMIPVVALIVWVIMMVPVHIRGRHVRDAIERFSATYAALTTATVSLLILLHAIMLSTVLDWSPAVRPVLCAMLGTGLIAAGNVVPRVRRNWIMGIRTRATMSDESLWVRMHRVYGRLLVAHGVVVIAIAFLATDYAFMAATLSIVSAAVLAQLLTSSPTTGLAA